MAAIEEAIGEMADYSEIDVQLSKDGVPVVCHDLNLSRVAGVDVSLKNLTLIELEQLDVGGHFSSRFEGEKIPSLEEVLEACKGRIRLNIELKSIGTKSPLPEVVTEMIKENGNGRSVCDHLCFPGLSETGEGSRAGVKNRLYPASMPYWFLFIKMNLWILSASGPAL